MAYSIFDLFAKLCETLVIALWYKQRVVAEALCAVFFGVYSAAHLALELIFPTT